MALSSGLCFTMRNRASIIWKQQVNFPPNCYRLRKRSFAAQAQAEGTDHVFDIPIELFAALGGIRYDQDIEGAGPEPWQVLTTARSRARPMAK